MEVGSWELEVGSSLFLSFVPSTMWVSIFLVILGFVMLIKGADWLVNGASALARKFNISELAIGLTIVAFGTSAPELVVNSVASFENYPDIVYGNIIGSNLFNLFVILGIAGLILPIRVQSSTVWKEIPISLLAIIVLFILSNNFTSHEHGNLGRVDACILLGMFGAFLYYVYRQMKSEPAGEEAGAPEMKVIKIWILIIIGLGGLIGGGKLVVDNAILIARGFGMSEKIIGLTIVAAGTSLPELLTSVVAALRKNSDIAIGNVIGSNIFNIFLIMSVSALIRPLTFNEAFNTDMLLLILGTLVLFTAMFTGKKKKLDRWEAAILLLVYITYSIFLITRESPAKDDPEHPAEKVISSILPDSRDIFEFHIDTSMKDACIISAENSKVKLTASDQVALCRGAYEYISNACNGIVSWSGKRIRIPDDPPGYYSEITSPHRYRFYFNVVTHGYTTAYWDWPRWEKEIDWMALHGINMPLIPGAHEAILRRVFLELGLTPQEVDEYLTGPAYFPWNRMGNVTGWNGPPPATYYEKQIDLAHKIIERMRLLDMHPIVPAFAGFVPPAIKRLYPEENIRQLSWGGFEDKYKTNILEPGSSLFIRLGKMYVEEWEKEFGKAEYYLADSFNEMDVPLNDDSLTALDELAGYGASVFRSIHEANPEATWVMQGWTFPYYKKNGELFWTPQRLKALFSEVPDDKLLILDLANEYNLLWWQSEPSWVTYEGFFGKRWIYSFIPNMGGKTSLNGRLDIYASMPFEAMEYPDKGNLSGFGFAPEGIENNEIIYELLTDVGWSQKPIDIDSWIEKYCTRRYGVYPPAMKKAFSLFLGSCLGSFTDHPRHSYQFRPDTKYRGSVNRDDSFGEGVAMFLSCKDELKDSPLYVIDAIEYTSQYLGSRADLLLEEFQAGGEKDTLLLSNAMNIMLDIDRLLESHPNWKLKNWVDYARGWGNTEEERNYYESDARRLITTWGGWVNEYSARTWAGLIRDYYIPRWENYYAAKSGAKIYDMYAWEEAWINSTSISEMDPFDAPLEAASRLISDNYPGIRDTQ